MNLKTITKTDLIKLTTMRDKLSAQIAEFELTKRNIVNLCKKSNKFFHKKSERWGDQNEEEWVLFDELDNCGLETLDNIIESSKDMIHLLNNIEDFNDRSEI